MKNRKSLSYIVDVHDDDPDPVSVVPFSRPLSLDRLTVDRQVQVGHVNAEDLVGPRLEPRQRVAHQARDLET